MIIIHKTITIFLLLALLPSCNSSRISYTDDPDIILSLHTQQDTLYTDQRLPISVTITNKGQHTKRIDLGTLHRNSAMDCFEILPWELLVTYENGEKMWSNIRYFQISTPYNRYEKIKPNETKTIDITMTSLRNTSWYTGDEEHFQQHEALKGKYKIKLVYIVYHSYYSTFVHCIKSNELLINYK